MDRTEMILEVRRRIGEDSPDFWVDTDIIRALDAGVRSFSNEERWPWLYTEVTGAVLALGTHLFTLPADLNPKFMFNLYLRKAGETAIVKPIPRRVVPAEGLRLRADHSSNGQPLYYYMVTASQSATGAGDETMTVKARFVPAADRAYDVDISYYRRPALLTGATQEPEIPEDYQEAVVAYATARMWQHELAGTGADMKAQEQLSFYMDTVAKARRELMRFAEDEELALGKGADEEERAGYLLPFPMLPNGYGPHSGWWG